MARRLRGMGCSFCGKTAEQTLRLIAGPNGVYICSDCIALCNEILAEGQPPAAPSGQGATLRATTHAGRVPWWRRLIERWHQTARPRFPHTEAPKYMSSGGSARITNAHV